MAKSKRIPSAAQRDKNNILLAKKLKAAGIISKQAKLHSGHYISKEVLRKVRENTDIARLDYRAVKVSKKVAQEAKERGYKVVQGNRIVGPNSQAFRNRLQSGTLTGVKPVKGGYMEEVVLDYDVYDLYSLAERLEEGIDSLKMPEEAFAFKLYGNESYRTFYNSQDLLKELQKYQSIFDFRGSIKAENAQDIFENFTIFRLHPNSVAQNIPGPTERKRRRIARAKERMEKGGWVTRKSNYKPVDRSKLSADKLERLRKEQARRQKAYREKLKNDPVRLAKYKARDSARHKK